MARLRLQLVAALLTGGVVQAAVAARQPLDPGRALASGNELESNPDGTAEFGSERTAADSTVPELERALGEAERQEQALQHDLDLVAPTEERIERRLRARARLLYRMLRAGLLPASGGFGALLDHASRIERARRGFDADSSALRELQGRRGKLKEELDAVAARRTTLLVQRQAVAQLQADLSESDERQRSFDRALQTTSSTANEASSKPAEVATGRESFSAMKGHLPFPLVGRFQIRRVPRQNGSGPGLELQAPAGTAVRAVHGGRVAFADKYEPFGSIVILDHGDHFYTLMGNLGSTDVRVGDELSPGARIGKVGAESGKAPHLYFEVRRGESALDPARWLGL
jgi:septal ring factor EnvC (AmiA/AmiB activator)